MFWKKPAPMPETVTPEAILAALDTVIDPHLGQGLNMAGVVKAIWPGAEPRVEIELGFPANNLRFELAEKARQAIAEHCGVQAQVQVSTLIHSHAVQKNLTPLPNIKNIIAIASGKGGVGKSTVAVNFALALKAEGAKVGILDADIYGPSQPRMLGVSGKKPSSPDGTRMHPVEAHGIQSMSIGYLVPEDQPMIWRGPMVTQALAQLLNETVWKELDYLVIDLPPGTGDIQLSLSQRIPVSGAVIVTTPQDIALLDAQKGLQMFRKVEVPVLGVVENMAMFCCPKCGHEEAIFGEGGGEMLATEFHTELLGRLPLLRSIREQADSGTPTVAANPESETALTYRAIARLAAARLAHGQPAGDFPSIEIV